MIPSSVERVPRSTASQVNEQIRRNTMRNVARYAAAGPAAIEGRLVALDREWDIERVLALNFGLLVALSTLLGFTMSSLWLVVAGGAGGFLALHAVQGWCPPLPIFRRLGVRTRSEIEVERHALKAMRGDYRDVPSAEQAARNLDLLQDVIQAVQRGGDRPTWERMRGTGER